jgi:hypothetical protein
LDQLGDLLPDLLLLAHCRPIESDATGMVKTIARHHHFAFRITGLDIQSGLCQSSRRGRWS